MGALPYVQVVAELWCVFRNKLFVPHLGLEKIAFHCSQTCFSAAGLGDKPSLGRAPPEPEPGRCCPSPKMLQHRAEWSPAWLQKLHKKTHTQGKLYILLCTKQQGAVWLHVSRWWCSFTLLAAQRSRDCVKEQRLDVLVIHLFLFLSMSCWGL